MYIYTYNYFDLTKFHNVFCLNHPLCPHLRYPSIFSLIPEVADNCFFKKHCACHLRSPRLLCVRSLGSP